MIYHLRAGRQTWTDTRNLVRINGEEHLECASLIGSGI